jgi:hypothetical protein
MLWAGLAGLMAAATGTAGDDPRTKPGEQFHAQLREIARTYKTYRPVDFAEAAWAPADCRAPIPYQDFRPGEVRPSASMDKDTHGQKLYFLFSRNRETYLNLAAKPQAEGQVIVKESWTTKEATEEERTAFLSRVFAGYTEGVPFARKDGKLYRTDKQGELFIMFKTGADKADTDQGWVYGTVTPDGKSVTSAGRVESCMNCHKAAKHDRLFGLPGELAKTPFEIKELAVEPIITGTDNEEGIQMKDDRDVPNVPEKEESAFVPTGIGAAISGLAFAAAFVTGGIWLVRRRGLHCGTR